MAPKSRVKHERQSNYMKHAKFWKTYIEKKFTKEFLFSLLWDPKRLPIVSVFLVLAEIILNIFVIHRVKYTEIDWVAYMQEVEGVVNGTLDYTHLKGDTGPLVYPAGFVYIFTVLYYLTNQGQNIRLAQYIFAGFYIVLLSLVLRIYSKTNKVPPYVIILACCTSYRIHSIFVLRLFNDPVAMLLFYVAVNLFLDSKWSLGSLFYSLAVSVKMNILLFAPALLLAYLTSLGLKGALIQLTICAFTQLILGLPFLLSNPIAYLKGSFNLGRIFLYEWTVNWRFLPEEVFINQYFHLGLLVLHLALLVCFYSSALHCLCSYATLKQISEKVKRQLKGKKEKVDMGAAAQLFILPLFTANLVGVACSRSLHYQFYVWYFHTLPYLMWSTPYSNIARLCLLGVVEFCWNTFPSTLVSSAALHVCHGALLYGLWKNKPLGKGRQQ